MHGSIKLVFRLKVIPLNLQKTIMLTEKIKKCCFISIYIKAIWGRRPFGEAIWGRGGHLGTWGRGPFGPFGDGRGPFGHLLAIWGRTFFGSYFTTSLSNLLEHLLSFVSALPNDPFSSRIEFRFFCLFQALIFP